MNQLLIMFLAVVLFNLALFVPAFILKTDKLTDASYALSFIALAVFGYARSTHTALHLLVAVLVCLWGLRLGSFLVYRVTKKGKDVRFDGMRENFFLFLRFWLLQVVSVFIVLIAASVFWQTDTTRFNLLASIGILVFACGLILEAVADWQKWLFSQMPGSKGAWIDEGVWSRSRHPNYLGEIMVWLGIYALVFPSLSSGARLQGLASPVYVIILLLFVSGIPLLEKSADKRWGGNKDYQAYKKRVPVLLPRL